MAAFSVSVHMRPGDTATVQGHELSTYALEPGGSYQAVRLALGQPHSLQEVTVFGTLDQLRELASELTRVVDLLEADRRPELSVAEYMAREVGR